MTTEELTVVERFFERLGDWAEANDDWLDRWYFNVLIYPIIAIMDLWARAVVYCRWLFSGVEFETDLLYE